MVTNPYCSHCSNIHALLKDWIERNPNLQLRIVFAALNHEQDPRMPVARHLMMLNNITDKQVVENALNAWYLQDNKNYKEWAKSYPTIFNDNASEQISKQYEWCQMAEIKATSTILVDGHRLPDNYQLQDIRYLLTE
ncbi:hypothetical protein LX99_00808 [Mucilaginibacter oryzae]|uniref:Thioredoxin-like protein n=1 Tax=Mucilaginibacter oryzae TaxID=468058 RepID=A0A316HJK7_9SPHI|nr:hypothetical protein [Mucilaginibacter oryzae]PWK80343.1 hypothetical protein LX99_00808 [Mucilaginibacter oryzae]